MNARPRWLVTLVFASLSACYTQDLDFDATVSERSALLPEWFATASLAQARSLHSATLLPDGRVLVAGGESSGATLGSTEIFDPLSQRWSAGPSLGVPRFIHVAAALPSGLVAVAGGTNGPTGALDSVEVYDALTDTWEIGGEVKYRKE